MWSGNETNLHRVPEVQSGCGCIGVVVLKFMGGHQICQTWSGKPVTLTVQR